MPLLLGLLAVTAWLGVQAWQLEQDRQQLLATQATMAPTLDKAGQLRRSLDLLAADTQRLADGGNGNARLLVDELRKRGITINPNSPPVQPAASADRGQSRSIAGTAPPGCGVVGWCAGRSCNRSARRCTACF